VGGAGASAAHSVVAQCCVLAHRGIEPRSRWGDRAGYSCQDRGLEHTYIYADADDLSDPDGYVHLYSYTDRDAYPHADIDPYAYTHSNSDGDAHPHGD
jgi:hypothetical protein